MLFVSGRAFVDPPFEGNSLVSACGPVGVFLAEGLLGMEDKIFGASLSKVRRRLLLSLFVLLSTIFGTALFGAGSSFPANSSGVTSFAIKGFVSFSLVSGIRNRAISTIKTWKIIEKIRYRFKISYFNANACFVVSACWN